MKQTSRRSFPAAAAVAHQSRMGATERIRIGCISLGVNGFGMLNALVRRAAEPAAPVQVVAVSDIYEKRTERAGRTDI